MKKLACIAVALFGVITLFEASYYSHAFPSPHDKYRLPRVIAHKSHVEGKIPNTLSGVYSILESGVGGLELDIQLSKDGIPIVFHDDDLYPLTTEHGSPADKTAAELQSIHYVKEGEKVEETVITLEKVLQVVGSQKFIFLDIKAYGYDNSKMIKALSALISKYNLYDTVVVESFNPLFLIQLLKENPQILRCYDFAQDAEATVEESPEQLAKIPWLLKTPYIQKLVRRIVRPDILGVRFSVPLDQIRTLSTHGYPIISWTVDDSLLATKLMQAGALGVQTNHPECLRQALKITTPITLGDASGLNVTEVDQIIEIESEQDIQQALFLAKETKRKVSIAGAQHTMGGHTLAKGNLILQMKKLRQMEYSPETKRLTVQGGATWKQVQAYLDPLGRSIKVMQSDNIFTVGGTLSANAHGWQVKSGPIASTVHSFRLMTADGRIFRCSRTENSSLFSAVLGGYGLLGVIIDAEIETVTNDLYCQHSHYFPVEVFPEAFTREVKNNPKAELAYGRVSLGSGKLLTEASLNFYERVDGTQEGLPALEDEKIVRTKRNIFRMSEFSEAGKWVRWEAEKQLNRFLSGGSLTRNTIMNPDIHVLWPVNSQRYDVLHEYFVPPEKFEDFIEALRLEVLKHDMNLLNVTIRQLNRDEDTLLAYANQDVFSFVLLFSQRSGIDEEQKMATFTQGLIDAVLDLGGTFYLPYRLHYTREQVAQAYPRIKEFLVLKREYDPSGLFTSQFYEHIH